MMVAVNSASCDCTLEAPSSNRCLPSVASKHREVVNERVEREVEASIESAKREIETAPRIDNELGMKMAGKIG